MQAVTRLYEAACRGKYCTIREPEYCNDTLTRQYEHLAVYQRLLSNLPIVRRPEGTGKTLGTKAEPKS